MEEFDVFIYRKSVNLFSAGFFLSFNQFTWKFWSMTFGSVTFIEMTDDIGKPRKMEYSMKPK